MTQALSFHDISSKSQPLKTQIQGRTNWQECFVCVLMWRLSQNCGLGVGVPDYNSDLPPAQCFERPINLYDHNMPHAHHMT